jgi:Dimerisation domain
MKKTLDIIFGRWKSQILYTGDRLGIFDCATSHAKTASNISDELDLDEKLAYRLLNAPVFFGFLKGRT